jgi:hypothetical protein
MDSSPARGRTAASTSAIIAGSRSRAGSSSSAARARARGQSSIPSASAAHVAGSRPVSRADVSASLVAAVREQLRITASSSAKNSLTPVAASRPGPGSQSGDAAPGSPSCRSRESGRRTASSVISSARYAASRASICWTRCSSTATSASVRAATGIISPNRVGRAVTPRGSTSPGHGSTSSEVTVTPTPKPPPSNT